MGQLWKDIFLMILLFVVFGIGYMIVTRGCRVLEEMPKKPMLHHPEPGCMILSGKSSQRDLNRVLARFRGQHRNVLIILCDRDHIDFQEDEEIPALEDKQMLCYDGIILCKEHFYGPNGSGISRIR